MLNSIRNSSLSLCTMARIAPTTCLRRVSASQELTVEAAVTGSREKAFEAMLADPLAGRIDYERLREMTDALLEATAAWLPQFAPA